MVDYTFNTVHILPVVASSPKKIYSSVAMQQQFSLINNADKRSARLWRLEENKRRGKGWKDEA